MAGARPAQLHKHLEEPDCDMSVPISERIITAMRRSIPWIVKQRKLSLILFKKAVNDLVYLLDAMVDVRKIALDDMHPFLLPRSHIEALDGFNHI